MKKLNSTSIKLGVYSVAVIIQDFHSWDGGSTLPGLIFIACRASSQAFPFFCRRPPLPANPGPLWRASKKGRFLPSIPPTLATRSTPLVRARLLCPGPRTSSPPLLSLLHKPPPPGSAALRWAARNPRAASAFVSFPAWPSTSRGRAPKGQETKAPSSPHADRTGRGADIESVSWV